MSLLPQPPRGASLDEMDKAETSRWFTEVWRKVNSITGGGGAALAIKDEGIPLTATAASLNFTGAGVTATAIGNDVIVSVPGASVYTLPIASPTTLGGIKVGTNLSIDGTGVLSATGGSGGDIDGGTAASVYLPSMSVDGGGA